MLRAVTAVMLICAACWPALSAPAGDEARVQKQQELERVRSRIQSLASALERDRGERDELRQQLENAEKAVAEAAAQLRRQRADYDRQAASVKAAQAGRASVEKALEAQRRALARQVRAAYMIGERGQARLLLSQQSAQPLGRMMTYYDYLNRARTDRIRGIQQQAQQLAEAEQKLQQELVGLEALRAQQQQTLAALEASRGQRKTMLASLSKRISGSESEIRQLQSSEKDIQGLLASLQDVLADIPLDLDQNDKPFQQLRGKLPWPLRGKLLADYGAPKAGGRLSWSGLWIAAKEGAPVRAVARGRVAYVGYMHRYGLMVIVEHDNGYFTLYGHNEAVAKTVGEWIAPGQVIASAGASGGHEESGLYFELRKGSQQVDPRDWLTK